MFFLFGREGERGGGWGVSGSGISHILHNKGPHIFFQYDLLRSGPVYYCTAVLLDT